MSKQTSRRVLFSRTLAHVATRVFVAFLAIVVITSVISITRTNPPVAQAAAPATLNFQARLLSSTGSLVPDGTYNVEFKIYNASSSSGSSQGSCTGDANCLWTETRTGGNKIEVKNGYLSAYLGDISSLPTNIWDQQLWLTMNIGGTGSPGWDGEMTPRIRLTSVPYAFQATVAESAKTLSKNTGSFTGTVDFSTLTADRTYLFPDTSLATTGSPGTICVYNGAASNCPAASGSAYYIQNDTVLQTAANFNIQARDSSTNGTVGGVFRGAAAGQTVNLLQFQASNGTVLGAVTAGGNLEVASSVDTRTAGTLTLGGATATAVSIADTGVVTTINGSLTVAEDTTFNGNATLAAGKYLRITGDNTAGRPASPGEGTLFYDTTTKQLLVYANGKWKADSTDAILVAASNSSQRDKDAADYVADGTSDQVEINAALTAGAGRKVILLSGSYSADGTILVPNYTTLMGANKHNVYITLDIGGGSDNLIENSDTTSGQGITIQDIDLISWGTGGTQHGLYLTELTGPNNKVTGVGFSSWDYGDSIVLDNAYIHEFSNNQAMDITLNASGIDDLSNNYIGNITFEAGTSISRSTHNDIGEVTVDASEIYSFSDNRTGSVSLLGSAYIKYFTNNNTTDIALDDSRIDHFFDNYVQANMVLDNDAKIYDFTNNFTVDISLDNSSIIQQLSSNNTASISINDSNVNSISNNNIRCYETNCLSVSDISGTFITDNYFAPGVGHENDVAINIDASAGDIYVADNVLNGMTISDASSSTIYGGQVDGSGDFMIQPAGTIELIANTNVTGNLSVSGDGTFTGGDVTIATTTATDDQIKISITTGGSNQFTGTITNDDLTGTRTWTLPDESGTFCMQGSSNCGFLTGSASDFIQNQNASQQTSSNFWISGTGRADTALQAPSFDTASAGTLSIGNTNATTIDIATNAAAHTINIGTGNAAQTITIGRDSSGSSTTLRSQIGGITLDSTGITLQNNGNTGYFMNTALSHEFRVGNSGLFEINDEAGTTNYFYVDPALNEVGVATGSNFVIQSGASMNVQGTATFAQGVTLGTGSAPSLSYTTPGSTALSTFINIPNYTQPAYGTILAFGVTAASPATARALLVADARTVSHQPTIGVLSPNENDIFGFSWDGSNTAAALKTLTGDIVIKPTDTAIATFNSGTGLTIDTGNPTGTRLNVNGGVEAIGYTGHYLDVQSGYGSPLNLGTDNAEHVKIGGRGGTAHIDTDIWVGTASLTAGNAYLEAHTNGVSITRLNSTDSATAFNVQNAASATLFNVNTTGSGALSLNAATTIAGNLTVTNAGNVAYQKGSDYSTTGAQTDVNLGTGVLFRLTGASAQTINSIAGGADGRIISLVNAGANAATLLNDDGATGTASMRIITGTGANLTIAPGAGVQLAYDSTSSRWRVVGGSATAGGGANQQLSNLSGTVAVNLDLNPGGDNTLDLGSSANSWKTLYADTSVLTPTVDTATTTTLNLGTTTANAVSISRTGVTTTINGALAVSQGTTLSGNLSVTQAGNVAFQRNTTDYTATGTQDNINFGTGALFRITSASALTINGIAGGADGRIITLVNASANTVTIGNSASGTAANHVVTGTGTSITIPAGASQTLAYDSSSSVWRVIGSTAAANGYIQLQSTTPGTAQTGNFNISGTGIAATALLTPSLDAASAGSLSLGTTTATSILIGGNAATTISVGQSTATNTVNVGNGNLTSGTQTVNIGTGVSSTGISTVTVGSTNAGSGTTINGGSAGITLSTNAGSAGTAGTIVQSVTNNSTGAFQVQNAAGAAALSVNTNVPNLIQNPSFENGSYNGWSLKGSATVLVEGATPPANFGNFGMQVTTNTSANNGIKYNIGLQPSTQYTFSFFARRSATSAASFNIGRADNGSDTDCLTNQTFNTTYTQFSCTFTTGSTIGEAPNVYIKQTDTASDAVYIDGVTLVAGATARTFTNNLEGSALQVDSSTNNVTINVGNDNTLQAWRLSQNILPAVRTRSANVAYNGYIYVIGGGTTGDGGSPVNTSYYAKVNSDGTTGAWTTTSTLGTAVSGGYGAVVNGYVYVVGGSTSGGSGGYSTGQTLVQYARINPDGTLGTWTTTTGIPQARYELGVTSANGYIYAVSGRSTANGYTTTIYYAKVNADGTISSWNTNATALAAAHVSTQPVVANGKFYVTGGYTASSNPAGTEVFTINKDGSLTNRLVSPTNMDNPALMVGDVSVVMLNNTLYQIGGYDGGAIVRNVYGARLLDSGIAERWTANTSMPTIRENVQAVTVNGYVYIIGGNTVSNATTQSVYFTSTGRTQIYGNLDLLGAGSGQNLSDSNSGGSLTAGNTLIAGTLQVQEAAAFNNNMTVNGTLAVNADATFRNIANSTTAFQVENAAGTTILNVDTTNGRVGIGTNAPSYDLSFGGDAARSLRVENRSTNAAGSNLTIAAGGAGSGGSAFTGGTLTLQGGAAGGTGNANGGGVTIAGGAGTGTGVQGLVTLSPSAFFASSTVTLSANNTLNTLLANATNIYSTVPVNATGAGYTLTVDLPTVTTVGRVLYIAAVNGSNDFTLSLAGTSVSISMKANSTATLIYNGTGWTAAGASSSTDLQAAYNNTLSSAGGAEVVLNNTASSNGLTIRNNASNPIIGGGLLEVQNSIGSNLISVNNNAVEYAVNGGAETSTNFATNWTNTTGGTVTQNTASTAYIATGQASVSVVTTTTNHGAKNVLASALTTGVTYSVSFAVKAPTNFSTLQILYSPDGTTTGTTTCATTQTVTAANWSRILCTFTAAGSINSSNAILIRQTDGTGRTFYIDNLSVTVNANMTFAADGNVSSSLGSNWTAYDADGGAGTTSPASQSGTIYEGTYAVADTVSAHVSEGVRNNMAVTPAINTQYLVTFYAKASVAMTGSLAVGFLPAGGNSLPLAAQQCVDYNTQSVSTTSWTRITCVITTPGSGISDPDLVIYQTNATARIIYIDALTINLNNNNSNNVQVGGANTGGPTTLLTLDRASTAPIAANNDAYLGSMYYDTTTGRIQCYEADGWGACGSSPDNIITLTPEYAGAVLNGSGVGTMTADFCSNESGVLTVGTLCATHEARNFYRWTSPQATDQTYSIYVSYKLPTTFKAFNDSNTIKLTALSDDLTNASATIRVFRKNAASTAVTSCGTATTINSSINTWQQTPFDGGDETNCGFAGGDTVIFRIDMTAKSNKNIYVENLDFVFTNN